MNIVNLYQGGMSMGDRDYYLSEDSANIKIRDAYKKYITRKGADYEEHNKGCKVF